MPITRKPQPPQVRVAFRPPPDFEVLTALPAHRGDAPGGAEFTLLYDYPDFTPEPGWRAECGGVAYDVTAVDGRRLTCAERPGGDS